MGWYTGSSGLLTATGWLSMKKAIHLSTGGGKAEGLFIQGWSVRSE